MMMTVSYLLGEGSMHILEHLSRRVRTESDHASTTQRQFIEKGSWLGKRLPNWLVHNPPNLTPSSALWNQAEKNHWDT